MSKFKFILGILSCFLIFNLSYVVKADTNQGISYSIITDSELYDNVNGELYEFDSPNTESLFLQENISNGVATRSNSGQQTRTRLVRQYTKVGTSGYLIQTVYGGSRGATMSRSTGSSASVEGISVSVNSGVSYNVSAGQYGNIVIKSNIQYSVYVVEIRYSNSSSWQSAGSYTTKRALSSWYAPVYWR